MTHTHTHAHVFNYQSLSDPESDSCKSSLSRFVGMDKWVVVEGLDPTFGDATRPLAEGTGALSISESESESLELESLPLSLDDSESTPIIPVSFRGNLMSLISFSHNTKLTCSYLLRWCDWHETHITNEGHAASRSDACRAVLAFCFWILRGRPCSCQTAAVLEGKRL